MNTANSFTTAPRQAKFLTAGMVLTGLLAFTSATHAAPFTNGSFEQGGNPTANGTTQTLGNGDNSTLPGWTVLTTTQVSWDSNGAFGVPVNPGSGDYYLDLTGNNDDSNGQFTQGLTTYYTTGGVDQTFDTIAGDTYSVSYLLGSDSYYNSNAALAPGIEVFASSTAPSSYSSLTLGSPTSSSLAGSVPTERGVWTDEGFDFTATGSSTTLTFIGYSATDHNNYVGLDDVQVTQLPNREPNNGVPDSGMSAIFLALGLGGLAVSRKVQLRAIRA
jgi:hypothetical protein